MSAGPDPQRLLRERRGAIELWRLNRPDRMNAIDSATIVALEHAAIEAAADATLRAVVIAGAGERAFCAGADLKERRGMNDAQVRAFLETMGRTFDRIDRFPRPVIAAIGGLALGGGLELALACDFRVLAIGAELGLPEVSLAIIPGAGGTQRLPRLVGEARAKQMILLGERLSAEAALACGLVHRTAQDALGCALELAERVAGQAPVAISAALEAIEAGRELPLSEAVAIERRCYERALASEDRREALQAFAEKRRPKFRGR